MIIRHRITGKVIEIAWPRKGGTFNLSGANLRGANLRGADLRWADLSGADLYGADLSKADLSRADLSGANLRWADLRWADLSGADLRGADLYVLGQCQRGYVFLLRDAASSPRITAGCRDFSLDDAKAHWSAAHADDLVLRAHCLAMVATAEAIAAAIKAA